MKENTWFVFYLILGLGIGWTEAVWGLFWLWFLFLLLIFKSQVAIQKWWALAFGLGLIRDLLKGANLGQSSFFFLISFTLFWQITRSYRQPNRFLS
ncbi:MAG: hypothetical protein ABIB61_01250 [Candidatus Shapirobacteria bacterium]